MNPKHLIIPVLALIGCQPSFDEPIIPLDNYKIEEGFSLEVLASEPLLTAPVAMDFDLQGRIWVVEMPGFMEDMSGRGEDAPTGSIKILKDLDKDGIMDHSTIFLDSLVMPRALALVYNGVLYAEPPNLWFAEIRNDRVARRTLVDSLYAVEGNPEHQSNGLKLNIDNWIYSANSHFRYQLKDGQWIKEPTTYRGQWGISHDNFGRLYYNDNSRQLLGDYLLPNRLIRNQHYIPTSGVNQPLTTNQRVYPLHAALVNRGYVEGVLDRDSLLVNVTSACGPLVYRGGNFPEEYAQNVFVCIPEANLVKRNILTFHEDSVSAEQAWQGKEFLASTDEGFRPVNLSDGPDGNLYIVDMHRGIIQHYAYLSPYLRKKAKKKKLDTILDYGRILKVRKAGTARDPIPNLKDASLEDLVTLLEHSNGWIRDKAQQLLVFRQNTKAVPKLKKLASNTGTPRSQIHALYALNGLESLSFDFLKKLALQSHPDVISHILVLLEEHIGDSNKFEAMELFKALRKRNDPRIDLYLATTLGTWAQLSSEEFFPIMVDLAKEYKGRKLFSEAILSGIGESDRQLANRLRNFSADEYIGLDTLLAKSIDNRKNKKTNPIFSTELASSDARTTGSNLYAQLCASCHGVRGNGIQGLAPPLLNSEYVADAQGLGLIILHGLRGPIEVNGTLYDLNQVMPGLSTNSSVSDKDIADIISYATSAFSSTPQWLDVDIIKELRSQKPKEDGEYTVKELKEIIKKSQ